MINKTYEVIEVPALPEIKDTTILTPSHSDLPVVNPGELYEVSAKKCEEEVEGLLSFLEELGKTKDFSVAYIERIANYIHYGEYDHGFKEEKGTFLLANNEGLRAIYELLQIRFADYFENNFKHVFGKGWSLLPAIAPNVIVEIDSHHPADSKWIYKEVSSKRISKQCDKDESKLNK